MRSFTIIIFATALLMICPDSTGSTMCRPLSTFKIDCNVCRCSRDGREYSCTKEICPPPNRDQFIQESNEDGYVLLKPKVKETFDDDDFTLSRKVRHRFPYVDDEISLEEPASREDSGFKDVSAEDDVENLDDRGLRDALI